MLSIGPVRIGTITDLDPFRLPIDLLFPGRTMADLESARDWLEPHHVDFANGHILLGLHSHLLQVGGRNILIDTCVGEHKPRPKRADDWHMRSATGYLERLARHGLRPEDIDIVLCTHLHADHVGWNTRLSDGPWVPTFPKARYLIGRTEFAHWQRLEHESPGNYNHGAFEDSVVPLIEADQIDLVDEGFELFEGATLEGLPGHSPGQIGLCLCHGSDKAFFCADAVHSPVQVVKPDWSSRFCSDREQASITRGTLFNRSAETGMWLVPAHLRHYSALRVTHAGDAYQPEFRS